MHLKLMKALRNELENEKPSHIISYISTHHSAILNYCEVRITKIMSDDIVCF